MPIPKILVLHCPAGGGHRAAARAIVEAAAARDLEAVSVDATDLLPRWIAGAFGAGHVAVTERAPALYGLGYAAFDRRRATPTVADEVRSALDRAIGRDLVELVRRERPLAVVATHFLPLSVLGDARAAGKLACPIVGVVTDYTAHAFWACEGVDRFACAAGRAARELVRCGVDPSTIVATGIPVRAAFAKIPSLSIPLPGETLQVLLTSGGYGVGPIVRALSSFAGVPDVRVTVVCGDNDDRVAAAHVTSRALGVDATIVGFERDMASRMARAHVVVGKPGGLTASEALAAGRPMILVGACPGQETANEAWLVEQGAALSARAEDAGLVAADARSSGALERMGRVAREISPRRAADRVVDVALRCADALQIRTARRSSVAPRDGCRIS